MTGGDNGVVVDCKPRAGCGKFVVFGRPFIKSLPPVFTQVLKTCEGALGDQQERWRTNLEDIEEISAPVGQELFFFSPHAAAEMCARLDWFDHPEYHNWTRAGTDIWEEGSEARRLHQIWRAYLKERKAAHVEQLKALERTEGYYLRDQCGSVFDDVSHFWITRCIPFPGQVPVFLTDGSTPPPPLPKMDSTDQRLVCPVCGQGLYAHLVEEHDQVPAFLGDDTQACGIDAWNTDDAAHRSIDMTSVFCLACDYVIKPHVDFSHLTFDLEIAARTGGVVWPRGPAGRDYSVIPLGITAYTDLADFDEHEAKAHGWPPELIRAAIHEIDRREMADEEGEV